MWNRDDPHDVRGALFGGKHAVRVWTLSGTQSPPFTAVLACELEPGGSVGTHVQEQFPEIVICLAGQGSVRVNGETSPFGPGRVVDLPLGHTLSISNDANQQPLRYLIVKAAHSQPREDDRRY